MGNILKAFAFGRIRKDNLSQRGPVEATVRIEH